LSQNAHPPTTTLLPTRPTFVTDKPHPFAPELYIQSSSKRRQFTLLNSMAIMTNIGSPSDIAEVAKMKSKTGLKMVGEAAKKSSRKIFYKKNNDHDHEREKMYSTPFDVARVGQDLSVSGDDNSQTYEEPPSPDATVASFHLNLPPLDVVSPLTCIGSVQRKTVKAVQTGKAPPPKLPLLVDEKSTAKKTTVKRRVASSERNLQSSTTKPRVASSERNLQSSTKPRVASSERNLQSSTKPRVASSERNSRQEPNLSSASGDVKSSSKRRSRSRSADRIRPSNGGDARLANSTTNGEEGGTNTKPRVASSERNLQSSRTGRQDEASGTKTNGEADSSAIGCAKSSSERRSRSRSADRIRPSNGGDARLANSTTIGEEEETIIKPRVASTERNLKSSRTGRQDSSRALGDSSEINSGSRQRVQGRRDTISSLEESSDDGAAKKPSSANSLASSERNLGSRVQGKRDEFSKSAHTQRSERTINAAKTRDGLSQSAHPPSVGSTESMSRRQVVSSTADSSSARDLAPHKGSTNARGELSQIEQAANRRRSASSEQNGTGQDSRSSAPMRTASDSASLNSGDSSRDGTPYIDDSEQTRSDASEERTVSAQATHDRKRLPVSADPEVQSETAPVRVSDVKKTPKKSIAALASVLSTSKSKSERSVGRLGPIKGTGSSRRIVFKPKSPENDDDADDDEDSVAPPVKNGKKEKTSKWSMLKGGMGFINKTKKQKKTKNDASDGIVTGPSIVENGESSIETKSQSKNRPYEDPAAGGPSDLRNGRDLAGKELPEGQESSENDEMPGAKTASSKKPAKWDSFKSGINFLKNTKKRTAHSRAQKNTEGDTKASNNLDPKTTKVEDEPMAEAGPSSKRMTKPTSKRILDQASRSSRCLFDSTAADDDDDDNDDDDDDDDDSISDINYSLSVMAGTLTLVTIEEETDSMLFAMSSFNMSTEENRLEEDDSKVTAETDADVGSSRAKPPSKWVGLKAGVESIKKNPDDNRKAESDAGGLRASDNFIKETKKRSTSKTKRRERPSDKDETIATDTQDKKNSSIPNDSTSVTVAITDTAKPGAGKNDVISDEKKSEKVASTSLKGKMESKNAEMKSDNVDGTPRTDATAHKKTGHSKRDGLTGATDFITETILKTKSSQSQRKLRAKSNTESENNPEEQTAEEDKAKKRAEKSSRKLSSNGGERKSSRKLSTNGVEKSSRKLSSNGGERKSSRKLASNEGERKSSRKLASN
jgi:hypothetical protein